ncbi:uncharacterized protein PRCAT00004862001 [Priceomyces carsonii]|uniref:uncharacterized protein n=1 Tax=Priceomyces carsonii TaxID=28549 RepID=UPI002EDBAEDD|nr:unnamed protein product [Priceomyces carsonii]
MSSIIGLVFLFLTFRPILAISLQDALLSFNDKINLEFEPSLPFPKWLADFTGLKAWPGNDPPYIPLDFINFNKIPKNIPRHEQGVCKLAPSACSFDCDNCVSFDDVYTCPKLSQTFDDGPSEATQMLIDKLKTKATFFTLGVNVVDFPNVYKRAMSKGHIMGSHTWSHKFLPSLTNEEIIAQIEWSIWAMNATANHLPKWFRPPYGGTDERVRSIVRQFGMQCVLWDFDTFDWMLVDPSSGRTESQIFADLNKFKTSKNGRGLILEHDVFQRTVNTGIEVNKIVGPDQLTVPQCVGGINYIKTF